MEYVNTLALIFLELTFIFVVMLLLFNQRKTIGEIPFCITQGMLLVMGEFIGGSGLEFSWSGGSFPIAPVVIMVPFTTSVLLMYITDGALAAQRLIIGALVTMGVFFYLGDLTRLQIRWVTFASASALPLEAMDFWLERIRRTMLAVVGGQLLALFILPTVFQRLRNMNCKLFICCAGALAGALLVDSLFYEMLTVSNWSLLAESLLPLLGVRMICAVYMAGLTALYITKLGRENEAHNVRTLEILFAFFGSYGRSKLLEANLVEWEGRYRVIMENASEMIMVVDKRGRILDSNPAAERLLNSKGKKLSGRNFADFFNEVDALKFNDSLAAAVQTGESTGQFYADLPGEGENKESVTHLALTVTPLVIGALEAFLVMGRDITEERNLESEKQRLNEELAHSQRLEALGQLAGGVAHDFNNNVHAILGHADLIAMRSDLDDKNRKHLEKIIEIAENSGQLTSQLLGFARKGKYRESDFDLRILVQRTADLFIPGSTDIEFTVDTDSKPLLVRGDQVQLQQVLLNLLINARDALRAVTGERELRLNIKLYETQINKLPDLLALPEDLQHQRSAVLLTITDNGCGMDENTMNRLFEPFFTTKPVGQGTGMGMAMAYGTIQSHQGAIAVESQVDIGTVIYIVLPKCVDI